MTTEPRSRVRLREYLSSRLRPLVFLLASVVATTAPAAFYLFGRGTLRVQASAAAHQVAEVIRRDAEERPTLWRYDSLKLIDHLRGYELQRSIARIDVLDDRGVPIDPAAGNVAAELRRRRLIWESEVVIVNGERVAEIWVAMSNEELRRDALLLFAIFVAVGGGLAALMYGLPMRAVRRAEAEIGGLVERLQASQAALSSLNEGLERQVEERSSQLSVAYRELQVKEQNLRDLSSRAVAMQEAERRAIARELHDSAGQMLTAIRINLQLVVDRLGGDEHSGKLAARTACLVDDTVEEIRRAVRTLGPSVLEDVGLVRAIERMCDDVAEHAGVVVTRSIALADGELPPEVETTCYRVLQEALTNVTRHASASRLEVVLARANDQLQMVVIDDGVGFSDDEVDKGRSRGIIGMRERVELLGGRFDLQSTPGGGTRVAATLPIRPL